MTYTATGLIATDPRLTELPDGEKLLTFRFASMTRTFNISTSEWEYGNTNWFTAVLSGPLATRAEKSLGKGDRILITGDIKVRDWDNGERSGTAMEIVATAVGHDLNFGTTQFQREPLFYPEESTTKPSHACDCQNCGN
jgi:single-strand DNA-binding protein